MIKKVLMFMMMSMFLMSMVSAIKITDFSTWDDSVEYVEEGDYGYYEIADTFLWLFDKRHIKTVTLIDSSYDIFTAYNIKEIEIYETTNLFDDTGYYAQDKSTSKERYIESEKHYYRWKENVTVIEEETNCLLWENVTINSTLVLNCTGGFETIETNTTTEEWVDWVSYNFEEIDPGFYQTKTVVTRNTINSGLIDWIDTNEGHDLDEWAAWWNETWEYRREISNLTSTNITYLNISYDPNMQIDFDDVRFLDSNQTTEYNYYLEQKVNSSWAIFRVETLGDISIFMYYGNAGVTNVSNIESIFGTGLTSFYNLDEASGNALDIVGASPQTETGTVGTQDGIFGNSRGDYTSSNYFGASASDPSEPISTAKNWTVSLWFNESATATNKYFYSWDNSLGNPNGEFIGALSHDDGKIGIYFSIRGGNYILWDSSENSVLNEWNHFVVTYDNTDFRMYLNGTLVHTITNNMTETHTPDLSAIGRWGAAAVNPAVNTELDDLQVYGRALSDDEVSKLYTSNQPNYTLGDEENIFGSLLVSQLEPANGITSQFFNVTFSCEALDDEGVFWLNLTIDETSYHNETGPGNTNLSFSETFNLSDGTYSWYCTGYEGNFTRNSTIRSLTVNTTPFIDYLTPPTLENYANVTLNYTPIAVNVSTPYFKNITYKLGNINGTLYELFYDNETYAINFSVTTDAHYHYNVTICTTTDKCNITETRHINHDIIKSVLNSPINNELVYSPEVTFNCSGDSSLNNFLTNISLYNNQSGSWQLNETINQFPDSHTGYYDPTEYSVDPGPTLMKTITNISYSDKVEGYQKVTDVLGISRVNIKWYLVNGTILENTSDTGSLTYVPFSLNQPHPEEELTKIELWLSRAASTGTAYVKNVTYFEYYNNVTNYTVTFDRNISTDILWNCEVCDNTTCIFAPLNYTVLTDKIAPTISLSSPVNLSILTPGDILNLNWSVNDSGLDTCWFEYNNVNTTVNCALNTTTFTYVDGQTSLTFYANDSFNNINSQLRLWTADVIYHNEVYNDITIATVLENFQVNITYDSISWSSASLDFVYNGTIYDAVIIGTGDTIRSNYSLAIPLVENDENKTFHWILSLTNVTGTYQFNSTEHVQLIQAVGLIICDQTQSPQLIFETFETLEPTKRVNATFSSVWDIREVTGTTSTFLASYEDTSETNSTWMFCITPNSSNYTVSVDLSVDATDYTPTNHYIVETDYSSPGENISLYLLNDSESTLTELIVRNQDNQPVGSAYITIQKYDLGTDTYYNVGMARTSSTGSDLAYLVWYDEWYRFNVVYQGVLQLTEGPEKISATPRIFKIGDVEGSDYEKFREIQYSLTYNENTSNFVLTFVDPTGEVSSACLRTIKRNVTNDYVICDNCESSNSATLYCNVASYGNGTFIASFYATGSPIYWVDEIVEFLGSRSQLSQLLGHDDSTGLAIIFAGIIMTFFLITPALGIFGILLGIIGGLALGFQPVDYGAFLSIVAVGIAMMWAVQR